MAGIGQSSTSSGDQSTPWNSQFNMGRSTTVDNHSNISIKYLPVSEKRRFIPEENGILSPNMYQYNRQPTGFQSSNIISNDKSFLSNIQNNFPNPLSSGNNAINYNMFQRTAGVDSNMHPFGNLDMSSQSKPGLNQSTRLGGMSQFIDSSSNSYLPSTPHRTISSGSMNPNVPIFNGQTISKNRSGSYNLDSHSVSINNQWDTHIGNFDSNEFPSLKPKPSTLFAQMSSGSNYGYSMTNKSMGQINYQMATKTGMPIMPGEHTLEFSIQQEDFPALPVAQNPITCAAESQRSSSASGINVPLALNSCDNSSQSHNSSIVDSSDFCIPKSYQSPIDQVSLMMTLPPPLPPPPLYLSSSLNSSVTALSAPLSSFNNNSQTHNKVQKKIILGPNNYIANIPNEMVADAFGLTGLVKLLGINDTYDNLNLLAPGFQTLSLNKELDSAKDIYHSYVSPLNSNCAGRPHDMDYPVPKEYRIRHLLIGKLADPLLEKFADETLFWIFYNLTGEECQLIATRQLINRQWRYNKRERYWLTRDPNSTESVVHSNYERGSYIVWDYENAKKVIKSLTVYYIDLENINGSLSTKLQLPFCYSYSSSKRFGANTMAMLQGRSMGNNSSTGINSGSKAFSTSFLQQPQPMMVIGSEACRVPLTNSGTVISTSATITSSNDVSFSQVTRVNNNINHSQQQQPHHHMIPPIALSPSSLTTNATTATTNTTSVMTTQQ